MTHIAFAKSLANGTVAVTSAATWDELKYALTQVDYHDTEEWDSHRAWENFKDGFLVKDSTSVWRYMNFEDPDVRNVEIFEGLFIDLFEMDPFED